MSRGSSTPTATEGTGPVHEPRPDGRDIVLLCNPRAGGRWKELANILDSPETRHVRWIVTDSIHDIGPALASLGSETQLVCVYGGDGTIQRILDKMYADRRDGPQLAFLGGGTMNVTSRWCGMLAGPGRNFRDVVRAYKSGQLLTKEVPVLEVRQGSQLRHCFTFGMGPIIRILNEYENGSKGKMAAVRIVAKSLTAIWTNKPADYEQILRPMDADVFQDGERLPYDRYSLLFCNSTGQLHIGVHPFVKVRSRGTFYSAAYAISKQEVAIWLPLLARGHRPVDPKSLIAPVAGWKQIAMSYLGQGSFPTDPRYINDLSSRFEVRTDERLYTVDGEVVHGTGEPIHVALGPVLKLAISPRGDLITQPLRFAKGVKAPDAD
ncbi:MAG: diacylglycerol kinase family protein [bacterium]